MDIKNAEQALDELNNAVSDNPDNKMFSIRKTIDSDGKEHVFFRLTIPQLGIMIEQEVKDADKGII